MLMENKCEWPNLGNRIVIARAAGGVRPIGLLFSIVRVQCKLRRIEAKMWEARNTEGFFCATQAGGVEWCVWEQTTLSEWATADGHAVATIPESFRSCGVPKADRRRTAHALSDEAAETAASALPGGQARGA